MAKSIANEEQTELERAVIQNHENISTLLTQALGAPVDLAPARADVLEGAIIEAINILVDRNGFADMYSHNVARQRALKILATALEVAKRL